MKISHAALVSLCCCMSPLHAAAQSFAEPPPVCSPAQSTTGLTCNVKGLLKSPKTALTVTMDGKTFNSCRDFVGQMGSGYRSFYQNSATGLCQVYTSSLAQQGFVPDAESVQTYSDTGCYSCAANCQYPTGLNYNFLDSNHTIGPWYSSKNAGVNFAAPTSQRAWEFIVTNSTKGAVQGVLSQSFQPCPGTYYTLIPYWQLNADPAANALTTVTVGSHWKYEVTGNFIGAYETDALFFPVLDSSPVAVTYTFARQGRTGGLTGLINATLAQANTRLQGGGHPYLDNGGFENGAAPFQLLNGAKLVHPGLYGNTSVSGNGSFSVQAAPGLFPSLYYSLTFQVGSYFSPSTTAYQIVVRTITGNRKITTTYDLSPGVATVTVPFHYTGGDYSFQVDVNCIKGSNATRAVTLDQFSILQIEDPSD